MSEINTESLRHSTRRIMREYGFLNKLPKGEDISASQVHALVEIGKMGKCGSTDLGNKLRLDKSSVTHITKQLLRKGWIEIDGSEKDSRRRTYYLTQSGQARLNLSNVRARQTVNKALSLLSEEEKDTVLKGMKLYADALEMSGQSSWKIERIKPETPKHNVVHFIGEIQMEEHKVDAVDELNKSVYEAETVFKDTNGNINFWCAYDGDQIIGTIGLQEISPGIGELKKCFVRKDFRGNGLAQDLLATLLTQGAENQLKEIYLGTTGLHQGAVRFYEKNGFVRIRKEDLPATFDPCELDKLFYRCKIS